MIEENPALVTAGAFFHVRPIQAMRSGSQKSATGFLAKICRINLLIRRLAAFSTAEDAGWAVARVIAEAGIARKEARPGTLRKIA